MELPPKRSIYRNLLVLLVRGIIVFVFLLLAYLFYEHTLTRAFGDAGLITSFILLWVFTSYVFLPRVHRFFTRLYLPDYYIGRTKSADGLLADPINLAVIDENNQLEQAMRAAGWHKADPLSPRSAWGIIKAAALKQSYPQAPVSSLLLFGRKQDMAFEKEVSGNPRARHHVRFWRTPDNWFLPGGYSADWLGAATYDKSVGLSLFTGQITHKIDAEIDRERDHLLESLKNTPAVESIDVLEHFTTAYHHRTGGGDSIRTDGAMPFITLR